MESFKLVPSKTDAEVRATLLRRVLHSKGQLDQLPKIPKTSKKENMAKLEELSKLQSMSKPTPPAASAPAK